jgi:AraC-like DNA-binding protein
MTDFFSFINAILLIGSIQGFVLGALLILKHKKNVMANRILAITLYFLSISILLHVLSHSNILPLLYDHHIIISTISIPISLLLYFYVKTLTERTLILKKNNIVHIIPFLVALLMMLSLFFNIYSDQGRRLIKSFVEFSATIIFIVYIILAIKKLFSYSKLIKNNYSNLEKINLVWLRIFIFCMTFLWLFSGILDIFFKSISFDVVWLLYSVFIFLIGYFGFNQPDLFSNQIFITTDKQEKDNKKYEKSSLTQEMADKYLEKLQTYISRERIFLESDLNLSSLSQKIGISVHHLSQIINERLGMNFYDYINSKRIEESQHLLLDPKFSNQNIASIGFQVGFNSLSAFNSAFKKFTHLTPSQYRNTKKV